jgi:hypothetical protein
MFAAELRRLRIEAGSPSFRVMSAKAHYAPSTLAEATRGVCMPSRAVVEAFARACGADPADGRRAGSRRRYRGPDRPPDRRTGARNRAPWASRSPRGWHWRWHCSWDGER